MPSMQDLVKSLGKIHETGVTELIGADEQVAQNQYAASAALTIATNASSGWIDGIVVYSTGGDELAVAGKLVFFDADPAIAAGATNITAAEAITVVAAVDLAAGDWISEAGGTLVGRWTQNLVTDPIPFHAVTSLYVALYHTAATTVNSAAEDNEVISMNMWFRAVES